MVPVVLGPNSVVVFLKGRAPRFEKLATSTKLHGQVDVLSILEGLIEPRRSDGAARS